MGSEVADLLKPPPILGSTPQSGNNTIGKISTAVHIIKFQSQLFLSLLETYSHTHHFNVQCSEMATIPNFDVNQNFTY